MRRLTDSEYKALLFDAHGNDITIIGQYTNSRQKLMAKCQCGHVWEVAPRSLLAKHGCPECGKKKACSTIKWHISQERFLAKIPSDLRSKIDVLSTYEAVTKPISVRCKDCGRVWESRPGWLYKGYGCDACFRKAKGISARKSHVQYISEVYSYHGKDIEIVSQYNGGRNSIRARCTVCEKVWEAPAYRLLKRGCSYCSLSKGERKINTMLLDANVSFTTQATFPDLKGPKGGSLRYDFALLDDKGRVSKLIEYDGRQHFFPIPYMGGEERFRIQQNLDKLKTEYCQRNSLPLLRVSYKELAKVTVERLVHG